MPGLRLGTGLVSALRRHLPALDRTPKTPLFVPFLSPETYLAEHYDSVPGFSSRISAEIGVALLRFQNTAGVSGPVGEIGVLMGRSFIALALAAAPGEPCVAIDDFTWPATVHADFLANCTRYGVDPGRLVTITANTTTLSAPDILSRLDGRRLRYLHVDGGHTAEVLRHDLALARDVLDPRGIICLDDMLHAQYPDLAATVRDELARDPDWVVFCIVDRADLIAASKYLICRRADAAMYQDTLRTAFPALVFPEPAEFASGPALILSRDAALVAQYRDRIERPAAAP